MSDVTLKNSYVEDEAQVKEVMKSLSEIFINEDIAFRELVALCNDPGKQPCDDSRKILKSLKLLEQDGSVTRVVYNVVLSASPDGKNLVDPY